MTFITAVEDTLSKIGTAADKTVRLKPMLIESDDDLLTASKDVVDGKYSSGDFLYWLVHYSSLLPASTRLTCIYFRLLLRQ